MKRYPARHWTLSVFGTFNSKFLVARLLYVCLSVCMCVWLCQKNIFTIRNHSCGKVMFQEFCLRRGGCTPPWADTPLGRHTPLSRHPSPETATAVDSTHPTGMHSCCSEIFPQNHVFQVQLWNPTAKPHHPPNYITPTTLPYMYVNITFTNSNSTRKSEHFSFKNSVHLGKTMSDLCLSLCLSHLNLSQYNPKYRWRMYWLSLLTVSNYKIY